MVHCTTTTRSSVGDLFQLPPVNEEQVFFSPAWKAFFPLFLSRPQRQKEDLDFFHLLEELRFGHLSQKSKLLINEKVERSQNSRAMINTTHVVSTREISDQINAFVCEHLPFDDRCSDPVVSLAVDTLNHERIDGGHNLPFKNHTNLQKSITIQEGARVMFTNNKLFEHNICNETIGVITKVVDDDNVEVTFPTTNNVMKIKRSVKRCKF